MNVDHVEAVNTKNNYICLQINKKNSIFLTISATFSFVLGSFLDKRGTFKLNPIPISQPSLLKCMGCAHI